MTPAQLWRVYRDAAVTTGMKRAEFVEAVKTQDVLVAADGPATEDHDTMTRLLVWQEWVLGRLPKGVG